MVGGKSVQLLMTIRLASTSTCLKAAGMYREMFVRGEPVSHHLLISVNESLCIFYGKHSASVNFRNRKKSFGYITFPSYALLLIIFFPGLHN